MTTINWTDALQGVTPMTGGQSLPPATYRFRVVGGTGKKTVSGVALELQLEVVSGPLQGRKQYHNENLPNGNTDNDKIRMGYFLGMCEAFGITGQALGQMFAGRPIDEVSLTYLAQYIVQLNRVVKANVRPQTKDTSRVNVGGWIPDDGIEPEPPAQKQAQAGPPPGQYGPPTTPNGAVPGPGGFPPQAPAGLPQGGFPPQQAPGQMAPAAQQNPGGLPLGGFPGSGGAQPTPEPAWATQQPVQGQTPQQIGGPVPGFQGQPNQAGQFPQQASPALQGPGQAAPAAQPQAAGMNQFQQPQAAQFPQPGQVQQATQEGFPGQQFPGQVNPAAFPPPGQQQAAPQGFQPPAGLPGGQPPQANI